MQLQPLSDFKVCKLKDLLEAGQFAVPKLQRVFVWNGPKAAKLLDSAYRGMPIGALTVWDTSKKNQDLLRRDNKVLPPFLTNNKRVWFLLDGQQRLSVLYRVQIGGKVDNGRHQQVDFGRVVFRVTEGNSDVDRFAYRKPVDREWISVPDILAANWKARLSTLSVGQLNRAAKCRERLLSYKVPIVRVETEEIDDARELFVRINSAGTPIAAADRAFARATRFDLREHAEQAWTKLPLDFQGLHHETLLQTRALLDGLHEVGADAMEGVAKHWDARIQENTKAISKFTKAWDGQQRATHRAIDVLKSRFCVLNDGLLPSQYMVATLSVFFCHWPKQPTAAQLVEIKKWFWATALGQRYSGSGYRQNIIDDASWFESLANGNHDPFKLIDAVEPTEILRATYGRRSSIGDAFFCLLISLKPQLLSNGNEMQVSDFASLANKNHKHHIFPRRHLIDQPGVSKRALNSILNLCMSSAEENSQFGSKPPRKYLEPYSNLRHFDRVLDRHLIPHGEQAGIWDTDPVKGYRRFLKEREAKVCAEFERAAGARLFRRDIG